MPATPHADGSLTATHWGTYRVHTQNGRVTALTPFERDPDPSAIGQGMADVVDGPLRITQPMFRRGWLEQGAGPADGRRGSEDFVALPWPEAIERVAAELNRVRQHHGNEAIYGGSYGWSSAGRFHHAQSQLKRFLNTIGGYTASVNTYSYAAAEVTLPHVLGSFYPMVNGATSWAQMRKHTDLFVAIGGIPLKNGQVTNGGVGQHVQRQDLLDAVADGVRLINISPIRSDVMAEAGADWLPLRPGSDVALLLAIAHTLESEGLTNQQFIASHTVGFERFRDYVLGHSDGQAKDADWAATLCQLDADDIRQLARRMARERTMISVSWSLTRQDYGEQPYWAAIAVAAMLGQIGTEGGGIGFGYCAMNAIGANYQGIPGAALPQGNNPVKQFIPVARIADMLLNPGERFDYNGQSGHYPEIKLVYWAGGNPFHHHQDLDRLRQAWQRPDTVIVHDWCWNAHARHADIILPAATHLERNDIASSSRDPFLVYMTQAIDPVGESRTDYAIFSALAKALGVEEAFTDGLDESQWLARLYDETRDKAAVQGIELPDFEQFRQQGWFKAEPPRQPQVLMQAFRRDPETHPLGTPSGKIELFSATVAGFGYDDCPGYPCWIPPREWLGGATAATPLHLISNQPRTKLHSQLDHGQHSRSAKLNGREPVMLHPDDAAARSIRHGDLVRVFNHRGGCLASAIASDDVRPQVVQLSTGAWYDPPSSPASGLSCLHGNPNVLTRDQGTSRLAQGPSAMSCLVEVERYLEPAAPVTVFTPPTIDHRKGIAD